MKYAGLLKNDFVNGIGVCVSYWAQGCPFHCKGCHNPQTWDYNGGKDAEPDDLIKEIDEALDANGVQRNLSILGGEPLCSSNLQFTCDLIVKTRINHPGIKIFIWSGYTLEQLMERSQKEPLIDIVFQHTDMLATGPFELDKRDVSLKYVGSTNQQVSFKGVDY